MNLNNYFIKNKNINTLIILGLRQKTIQMKIRASENKLQGIYETKQ